MRLTYAYKTSVSCDHKDWFANDMRSVWAWQGRKEKTKKLQKNNYMYATKL